MINWVLSGVILLCIAGAFMLSLKDIKERLDELRK
jgi:hypothetical protein